jgi:hypothetical protein
MSRTRPDRSTHPGHLADDFFYSTGYLFYGNLYLLSIALFINRPEFIGSHKRPEESYNK